MSTRCAPRRRRIAASAAWLALAPLLPAAAAANKPLELFGNLSGRIVLKATSRPHRVQGLVTLGPRSVLVVQPGAVVYFETVRRDGTPVGSTMKILGGLLVAGTASKPALFLADTPGRIVIGNSTFRDDRNAFRKDKTGVSVQYAYFHRVGARLDGGSTRWKRVQFHHARLARPGGKPPQMIVAAGRHLLQNVTFTGDGAGVGLYATRADTYPVLTIQQCVFEKNAVGLEIEQATLRNARAPLLVNACAFLDNPVAVRYKDDAAPLGLRGCYFKGARSSRDAMKYLKDDGGRGRVVPVSLSLRRPSGAGHGFKKPVDPARAMAGISGRPAPSKTPRKEPAP